MSKKQSNPGPPPGSKPTAPPRHPYGTDSEGAMSSQHEKDIEAVAEVLREYQHADGHASIQITVRNGAVQLIEDTRKRKPEKAEKLHGVG